MANKNILLIEPGYRNKYPPLGLMKVAQYHGADGKRDRVVFVKGEDPKVLFEPWDRIYVTTLFSFEFTRISRSLDYALTAANGLADRVFAGGIAVSLMPEQFENESRWHGIRFIRGLLSSSPAAALQLDPVAGELYADDTDSTPIENLIPDYSILEQIPYKYPVNDAYFTYASRGCIRKCSFCGVPKLEGAQRDTDSLSAVISGIEKRYGPKKDLLLMDNNVVASSRFKEIVAEIRDLGFGAGAVISRGNRVQKRRVDFNQGVDARILCKDPMYLRELSTLCLSPLRIAFDHLGVRGPYEKAVRYAHDFGMNDLSNYMLYNFHDSPTDLFERMRLNVTLNEELGIRIWSFPMRFQPTNLPSRSYIGEHWTRYELRSMQIILQATHGVVSGDPEFFKGAFGDTASDFRELLFRPQHFIFNRTWYERGPGVEDLRAYQDAAGRCTSEERNEVIRLLSTTTPAHYSAAIKGIPDRNIARLANFYLPLTREVETAIWRRRTENLIGCTLGDDEKVEDAGLDALEDAV